VAGGVRTAASSGETQERLGTVAAWREIWDEAARHFDEQGMASLVLAITVANVYNRLNRVTRQVAGAW